MPILDVIEPDWPAPKNVVAYSTFRDGGISQGPYASLNLGQHVGDNRQHVNANRALLPMAEHIHWLRQTHSAVCRQLPPSPQSFNRHSSQQDIDADGSFCTEKNLVCGVMSADCLPILLCDKQGRYVAAIHGGWRGLASGIIENTLQHFPCERHQLMAWLGPAISQQHFEVGDEVKQAFPEHKQAFVALQNISVKGQKYMADIYQIARQVLKNNGVSEVYGGEYCSYAQQDLFFSHRRATHEGQANTGRMVSCIYLR